MGAFDFLKNFLKKSRGKNGKEGPCAAAEKKEEQGPSSDLIFEEFSAIQKNAVSIAYSHAGQALAPGKSKIGGRPHVPQGFVWPYFEGADFDNVVKNRPLAFLAQFDLAEVKTFDKDDVLPAKGMLYFFYDVETQRWGFDPADKGCARVLYYDGDVGALSAAEFPDDLPAEYRIPEQRLVFSARRELPDWEEYAREGRAIGDWEEYDDARARFGCPPTEEPDGVHKLLGYADVIQDEMTEECETVARGIYCGDVRSDLSAAEKDDIRARAEDWTLLLQLGTLTDDDFELMWGDCGCIYFYIRRQHLRDKNFGNVRLMLQCT